MQEGVLGVIEDQNPSAMAMVDEFLAAVAEKAEWLGDGDLGGQASDLRERIAKNRAGEVWDDDRWDDERGGLNDG